MKERRGCASGGGNLVGKNNWGEAESTLSLNQMKMELQ